MSAYYNDSEPFVCDWLENLIREKLLPDGVVDRRPIQEVERQDVREFTQCHFFAGIGGWAYALQLASWGDRSVWTGSCPCQPFSAAGKGKAEDDPRHLWPEWFRLIRECRPERIFGEQVANAAGHGWLDVVSTDLEAEAYTVGSVVLGAHSVGAPHRRQRLWFCAVGKDTPRIGRRGRHHGGETGDDREVQTQGLRGARIMGNPQLHGQPPIWQPRSEKEEGRLCQSEVPSPARDLANAEGSRRSRQQLRSDGNSPQRTPEIGPPGDMAHTERWTPERRGHDLAGAESVAEGEARERERLRLNPWAGCELIPCRDGKARPVEPGTFPLAHGIPQRVGRLRAYGNAINPWTAAAFIEAYLAVSSPDDRSTR